MDMQNTTGSSEKSTKSVYGVDPGYWVYCGTYAKYNSGNLSGAWVCLNDYADRDAFYEALAELHKGEHDPEFMFQDFEGYPRAFYSESDVPEKLWELIDLDDHDREICEAWIGETSDTEIDLPTIIERFRGEHTTLADYVEQYWDDCGGYKRDDVNLWSPINYVDWERMAHDLEMSGDIVTVKTDSGVMVFSND